MYRAVRYIVELKKLFESYKHASFGLEGSW